MTTVFRHGAFWFYTHTRESPHEPPHVHVWFADADREARIDLVTDAWLDPPPAKAAAAMALYRSRKAECLQAWNRDHADRRIV